MMLFFPLAEANETEGYQTPITLHKNAASLRAARRPPSLSSSKPVGDLMARE